MTVTSIDIPRELLDQVKASTGLKTNREAVTYALEEIVRRDRQIAVLQSMHEHDFARDLNDPVIKAQARS
jgi:Arc/MetJ family transcription regulator